MFNAVAGAVLGRVTDSAILKQPALTFTTRVVPDTLERFSMNHPGCPDTLSGWNPTDAVISTVQGGLSGAIAGTGVGLLGQVAMNGVIGFGVSLVSMVAGGRRGSGELGVGIPFGMSSPILPGGRGRAGFARGAVSSTVQNAFQNIINSTSYGMPMPSRSSVLASPAPYFVARANWSEGANAN